MANKITKREMFNAIREVVADNVDMVAFIDHEIELLDKKSNKKQTTAKQIENEGIKSVILSVLTSEGMTVSEIQAKSEELSKFSNQKITALLKQLVDNGEVVKFIDKKKSYFSIITPIEG